MRLVMPWFYPCRLASYSSVSSKWAQSTNGIVYHLLDMTADNEQEGPAKVVNGEDQTYQVTKRKCEYLPSIIIFNTNITADKRQWELASSIQNLARIPTASN